MKAWGQTWTPENIRAYLLAPAKTIPGNKMDYDGAEDADTANVIIDFLKTLKP